MYRPSASESGLKPATFKFKNVGVSSGHSSTIEVDDLALKDLVDALTGASLNLNSKLFQCGRCKVFYQEQSYQVILTENNGKCVSCNSQALALVTASQNRRGRNADINAITLNTYQNHVGNVITFEGYVYKVLTSRRGNDYAVMFENKTWKDGFKMVAFRGSVDRIGGESFFLGLAGKVIKVRGLLIKHETFGHEIIVSDRAMIIVQ